MFNKSITEFINSDSLNGRLFYKESYVEGEKFKGNVEGGAYAIGKDQDGLQIKVYLDINPSIIDKSKKDPSITIPDFEKNSKEVILEQLTKVKDEENAFIAKWFSVTQNKKHDLPAFLWYGRMEVDHGIQRFNSQAVNDLILSIKELKKEKELGKGGIDLDEQIQNLENKLISERKLRVRLVYSLNNEAFELNEINESSFKENICNILEKYTVDGYQAGVILRVFNKDNEVLVNLCSDIRRTEDYRVKGKKVLPPMPLNEVIDQYMKYQGGNYILSQIIKNKYKVELIPQFAINGGPKTNSKYKNPVQYKKLISTYYDQRNEGKAVGRIVACRLFQQTDPDDNNGIGNNILTSAHAISNFMGHPLELDSNFENKYKLNYEGYDYNKGINNQSKIALAIGKELEKTNNQN